MKRSILPLFLYAALSMLCSGETTARTLLDYNTMINGPYSATVNLSAYMPDSGATAATHTFQGTLSFSGLPSTTLVTRNSAYVTTSQWNTAKTLPADFNFRFVQSGDTIIPELRGARASSHAWWEFVLEPGRVWNETTDNGYSRAAIPFALTQRNSNCTHNGVLMFLFKNDGSTSRIAFQITSETCRYLKFDMWGLFSTRTYTPGTVPAASTLIANFDTELANRLPVFPISQLVADYNRADGSEVVPGNFAIGGATHRSVYGLVIDGRNYRSDCVTRNGNYPYCDVMVLPSYSTAKSIVGALGLMRLEQLHSGARNGLLRDYVAQCQNAQWSTETMEHALDMTTGNYTSAGYMTDEGGATQTNFFLGTTHSSRIGTACTGYTNKVAPGNTWVYHSSDTYVLGSAMNAFLRSQPGHSTDDFYTQLIVPDVWNGLHLSGTINSTRRSYDSTAQPFTAYGLFYHHDDIARIARFMDEQNGQIGGSQLLDSAMLDAALQRSPGDPGKTLPSPYTYLRYNNGFWASNLGAAIGCSTARYVPFMSGFGGISVLLLPNDTVYYTFMDDGTTDWTTAAVEADRIRDYCN